jgi:hypothetical protein
LLQLQKANCYGVVVMGDVVREEAASRNLKQNLENRKNNARVKAKRRKQCHSQEMRLKNRK